MGRAHTNPKDLVNFNAFMLPRYRGDARMWAESVGKYLTDRMQTLEAMIGGGLRWQNLRSNLISGVNLTGAPATKASVAHDLGKPPEFVFFMTDAAGIDPHVTATNKANWTSQTVEFDFEANGNVDLLVI